MSCVFCLRDVALIVNKLHVWKPLYWYNVRFVHGPVAVLVLLVLLLLLSVSSELRICCIRVLRIRKLGAEDLVDFARCSLLTVVYLGP